MKVTPQGVGRQFWFRYYGLKFSDVADDFLPQARFTFDEHTIDVPIFCVEGDDAATQLWVIAFPCMEAPQQELVVLDQLGKVVWQRVLTPRGLNLNNSVTCRVKKRLTAQMQNVEQEHRDECAFVEPLAIYPYDQDHEIVRIHVLYPEGVIPAIPDPYDLLVNRPCAHAMVLESGLNDERRYHVVLSYRIARNGDDLVFAVPGTSKYKPGVLYFSPPLRSEYEQGFVDFVLDAGSDERYPAWFAQHQASSAKLDEQRKTHLAHEPLVSLILLAHNTPHPALQECVASIQAQTYSKWELLAHADADDSDVVAYLRNAAANDSRIRVIDVQSDDADAVLHDATGSYVALVDAHDLLEPNLLFEFVSRINQKPDVGLIYCDEDSFTTGLDTIASPRLKPHFNPDLLYAYDYLGQLRLMRRDLIGQVNPLAAESSETLALDLTLRICELAPVEHVAQVLYHRCQQEQTPAVTCDAAAKTVKAHFDRRGIVSKVILNPATNGYRVFHPHDDEPLVSVIIPTMDHIDLLDECVTTLLANAGWSNLEVLVVENNSTTPETFAYYDELLARDARIRLLCYEGIFNYSKIINFAAKQAKGTYLLLLNNDTRAANEGCIREMVSYFKRPEVGVVGPLLLFPDGLVQTAGLALMADERLGFINQNLSAAAYSGYLNSLACPRNYSAVLGAAQMVPKALFEQLGGYDEELAVTYNDVDFCWRVRKAGKLVVYTPYSRFFHREFATRGHDKASHERATQTEREAELMHQRWASYFEQGDPDFQSACDAKSPWFKLE